MRNVFVIAVDTQYDFMMPKGLLAVKGADALIAPMVHYLATLDPNEIAGVLFTHDTHEKEIFAASEEGEMFNLHCEKGTPGWENVLNFNLVSPHIPTYTLEKGVFDMWAEDDLTVVSHENPNHPRNIPRILINRDRDTFFKELKQRGINTIRIIGVAADFCVRDAIKGAVARGFTVEVIKSLTVGIERQIDQVVQEDFPGKVTKKA